MAESRENRRVPDYYKGARVVPTWYQEGESNNLPFRKRGDDVYCGLRVHGQREKRQTYCSGEAVFHSIKLQEFKLYQAEIFKCKRLTALRHGKDVQEEFSDEEILLEMESLYGPLDQKSERFKIMFEGYKASFLEQLEECLDCEEDMRETLFTKNIPLVDETCATDTVIRNLMHQRFTELDMLTMSCFDPRQCRSYPQKPKAEWLVLPRYRDSHGFNESYFSSWVEAAGFPEYLEDDIQLNLALMDPKFVLFPRYVICEYASVGMQILMRLSEVIEKYPCGTGCINLTSRILKTIPEFKATRMGFPSMQKFLYSLTDIMCYKIYRNSELKDVEKNTNQTNTKSDKSRSEDNRIIIFFPAALESHIEDLDTILRRIRHFILVLLELSDYGYLHVAEIEEQLKTVFQIEFNPKLWKFSSWRHFLEFSVSPFCEDYVQLMEIFMPRTREGLCALDKNWYLVKSSDDTQAAIDYLVGPTNLNYEPSSKLLSRPVIGTTEILKSMNEELLHFETHPIPISFLNADDNFPSITDQIFPNNSFKCYVLGIHSPSMLCLVLAQHSEKCKDFKDELNKSKIRDGPTPLYSQLRHGLPVIVNVPDYFQVTKRRGKVVYCDKKTVSVNLLDVGVIMGTEYRRLQLVPKELLALDWPTQAIQCKLAFTSKFYKNKSCACEWNHNHLEILLDICRKSYLYVTFLGKYYDKFTDENAWEIHATAYDPDSREIVVENVAEEFERRAAILDNADVSDIPASNPIFQWNP